MMRWFVMVVVLLLASCGGSHKEVVENPYSNRMKELTRTGVDAMQRERWQVAGSLFERALQAAQLANDQDLIGQAWYNLGVLHISAGANEKGENELLRAVSVSQRQHQEVTLMRARIALALLYQKTGRKAWQAEALKSDMPLDLHLSVARLAQLQKHYEVAHSEYAYVLKRSGKDRKTLLYKIDAHMGLALLHFELHEELVVREEIERVMEMSREVGAPREAAHALLLRSRLEKSEARKLNDLQDALAIYEALEDVHGQRDALNDLIAISEAHGDKSNTEALQKVLQRLEYAAPGSEKEKE